MMFAQGQLVATIPERCRICYSCVRDCPAKAIRIRGGQAEIVAERCIGCGNCVKVCSQGAKVMRESKDPVIDLLQTQPRVAVILAPSFPAEFTEFSSGRLCGALRALGFDLVSEVAFGADLVARRYHDLLAESPDESYIATSCPAVVNYVEKFETELVPKLAPVASPMVAMARVMHRLHGDDLPIVFVGPCIAKKAEAERDDIADEIAEVLSFGELRALFSERGIDPDSCAESDFDGPRPGLGSLFPVSHGLLQAAGLSEDLLTNEVVVGSGLFTFRMMLREFREGMSDARLLELLSCKGCVMGAGMTTDDPLVRRRQHVGEYTRRSMARPVPADEPTVEDFLDLDLTVSYKPNDMRMPKPSEEELREILSRLGKDTPDEELDCGACGYLTCRDHAIAIHTGMAESEMCLPLTIDRLKESLVNLNRSHKELEEAQHALIQSEKLASMGQLSAGIAHEVNNPLGVVLLYAGMLMEECPEGSPLHDDVRMVVEQASRCKGVVSGLLDFARSNEVDSSDVRLKPLLEQAVRSIVCPPGIDITIIDHLENPELQLDQDQILRVLTNLLKNAVEAMPDGGEITLQCDEDAADRVHIRISDTGVGIAPEHRQKIFEPLFTTKTMGKGTGLGLAVSYGIIKMHRGKLNVHSNSDPLVGPTGTTFEIVMPRTQRSPN